MTVRPAADLLPDRAVPLPAPDGVRLWSLRLLPRADDAGRALLDDADRALARALPHHLAVQLLARRALLQQVIASVAGCPVEEVGPLRGPGPRSVGLADGRSWFASTSSALDHGLIALADRAVGVDLEPVPGPPDALLVSSQLLHPAEHAWVLADPGGDGRRFLRAWVRKEAVVKCTGEGMSRELRSFAVDAARRDAPVLDAAGHPLGLRTVGVRLPGHVAAFALADPA